MRPDRRRKLNDSSAQLKADLLAEQPLAVKVAVYNNLEQFLDLSIKYARKWEALAELEPWKAQSILVDAVAWLREANSRIDRQLTISEQAAPKGRRGGVT